MGWLRTLLLILMLALFGAQTPAPWGWLWWLVPAGVALSLLVGWRFGPWGFRCWARSSCSLLLRPHVPRRILSSDP